MSEGTSPIDAEYTNSHQKPLHKYQLIGDLCGEHLEESNKYKARIEQFDKLISINNDNKNNRNFREEQVIAREDSVYEIKGESGEHILDSEAIRDCRQHDELGKHE